MYLPRSLISKLYLHLTATRHPLSPPVLLLVALEPDALCACRILTRLLKNDYIPHKIQPVSGYGDLERVGKDLVSPMMEQHGGAGGVVVCLGVGGMVDLGTVLGLEPEGDESPYGGVEVWVVDSRRPWNLGNVFGGFPLEPEADGASSFQSRSPVGVTAGCIDRAYKPGKGGIVVFDDGDIEDELSAQKDAYLALVEMPDVDDNGEDLGDSDSESEEEEEEDDSFQSLPRAGQKRKSWSDQDEEDGSGDDDDRPRQRRRSNSSSPIPESPQRPKQRGLLSLRDNVLMSSDGQDEDPPTAAQPPRQPSGRTLRRRLLRLKRQNESIIRDYYRNGASYSEPISSMVYSLASELGREDNDILWLAIVGVTSMELYGRSSAGVAVPVRSSESKRSPGWLGMRGARVRQLLRDEVRRLNPPELQNNGRLPPEATGVIPTTARSPEDMSIRLSPEPRFLLVRHWSLYEAMLHSPYLFSKFRTWGEPGIKRLHKFLAKMGISLVQCKQNYTHMDIGLKKELRSKLLKYGPISNLDDLVPTAETDGQDRGGAKDGWSFVRSWGWRATLSAQDVGVIIGALLEVGKHPIVSGPTTNGGGPSQATDDVDEQLNVQGEEWVPRFWDAFDALENVEALKEGLPTAKLLHKAIFNTGTALLKKKNIKHLRSFRMCVVKDSADARIFNHPGALTKLALWIGEALTEQERDATGRLALGGRGTPLVVASLDEARGVFTIVGTGGGGGVGSDGALGDREAARKRELLKQEKARAREESRRNKEKVREEKRAARRAAASAGSDDEDEDEDEDDESESEGSEASDDDSDEDEEEEHRGKGFGLNRFGTAFQDVIAETNARVRIDSFEHCVVEVRKEDLSGFLESLSSKVVVG